MIVLEEIILEEKNRIFLCFFIAVASIVLFIVAWIAGLIISLKVIALDASMAAALSSFVAVILFAVFMAHETIKEQNKKTTITEAVIKFCVRHFAAKRG